MYETASVTIDRIAPWAQDPSYSTKGHEPQIRSGIIPVDQVDRFIRENAPEAIEGVREWWEHTYTINAKDGRGYRTEVNVYNFGVRKPSAAVGYTEDSKY